MWNFGDILDAVEKALPPDAPALIHGGRTSSWRDLGARSNRLARWLLANGGKPDSKVGLYLRNCPEYVIALAACFKARLVPANVNYRYQDDELHYILENSDAEFCVFGSDFSGHVERIRGRLPKIRGWLQVGGEPTAPAESFDEITSVGDGSPLGIERSEDDLLFLYTGGTTGMPKAVMWRAADVWEALGGGAQIPANRKMKPGSLEEHAENVRRFGPGPRQVPACPLMHGTGLFVVLVTLCSGGCVVTLESERFDPEELLDTIEQHRAQSIVIVGDAFAKPILAALDQSPARWNLESLRVILSSGVMWSKEVKEGLLEHQPKLVLADMFGSSEAVGFGTAVTSSKDRGRTAVFRIGEKCKVFTEDHREVAPGSGEKGFIARSGPIPLGYYKDPEKTEATFPTIEGTRYSVPGDWCTVESDGTLTLLGRGSNCINTAGEKVYPEEVEEVLKTNEAVLDALVFGIPDDKWGQAVTAVVEIHDGTALDEDELRSFVRERLAGYKTPKRILRVDRMFRAPNGKADYKAATTFAVDELTS